MKLSSDDIRTIKDRLEAGAQQKDLAAEYGVSGPLISMIKTGKRRTT
jgi:predicted transcriptional regulator